MSINSALQAGVSGLISNSSAMAAISDNIANVNSTGYKRTRTDFTTLVKASSGTVSYNAGGVTATNRQLINQQGLLQSTSSTTDLAISGNGLFVISTQPGQLNTSSDVLFTRVGSFAPDENGNFKNQAGYFLQGWRIQPDGSVNTNPSDLTNLETVNIGNVSGTAQATDEVTINGNLLASQPVSAAATLPIPSATYDPANTTINMASGSVTPDVEWSFQAFDSRGGLKTFTIGLLKTGTANEWAAEIYVQPSSLINNTGSGLVDGQVRTGTLTFTSDGRLDLTAPNNLALLAPLQINDEAAAATLGEARWAVGTGVSEQTITLNLGQTAAGGGVTQYDSPSVQVSSSSNGAVFGDLVGVDVDKNGFVTANYNNGVSRRVFQIPVATFANPDGLAPENGGAYRVTINSGSFNMKVPGVGGSGLVASKSLENSNVDLATEFTGLITTQRAYSASAKIVTTADEMLDELIRIKR